MKKNLIGFLFGESQEISRQEDEITENLQHIFDACAEEESGGIESKKTPLAKALKAIGIDKAELELDPRGFALAISDGQEYANTITLLSQPDAIHKLAELGWVVVKSGDSAMSNEPAEYHVRFLEICEVDPAEGEKGEDEEAMHKKAQEFATTELDRDQDFTKPKGDGVGKPKEGEKPKKAIKDSIDVQKLLDEALGDSSEDAEFSSKEFIHGQDLNEYVEGYVLEYAGNVDQATMSRVIAHARKLLEGKDGQVDVYTVFAAMELAGLGKAADYENEFHSQE